MLIVCVCGKDTPPFFSTGSHAAKGMGRYHNRDRGDLLLYLIERDGAICQVCVPPHTLTIPQMKIDHIDGSENHNCVRNLRIICHGQNIKRGMSLALDLEYALSPDPRWIKSPLSPEDRSGESSLTFVCVGKDKRISANVDTPADPEVVKRLDAEKDRSTITATMRVNRRCEAPFNSWLNTEIQKGARFTYDEWANSGAHIFECSQETTKRYLDKRLNPMSGDLSIMVGGILVFRKSVLDDMEDQN
jgi:hypothetical protein